MATQTRLTADDVLRLADQGKNYELINGKLIEMSPTGLRHGQTEIIIGRVLGEHVDEQDLGLVVAGDVLFQLDHAAGLSRAADVAYIRADRLTADETPLGAFDGAPDLAVEIISPSNTANEIQEKVGHWLSHGTLAVLLVYQEQRSVVLWKPSGGVSLKEDDELNLDPIIPGFNCKVSALFPRRRVRKPS